MPAANPAPARPKAKNPWAKTRPKTQPYAIYEAHGWRWLVLKSWQSKETEAKDPYARWFCFVTSPFCPEGELGDCYVTDVKKGGRLVFEDADVPR